MRRITPAAAWGFTEELLAIIAERIDLGNRYIYAANSERGAKQPEPIEIRRPYQRQRRAKQKTKPRQATAEEMKAFFGHTIHYVKGS